MPYPDIGLLAGRGLHTSSRMQSGRNLSPARHRIGQHSRVAPATSTIKITSRSLPRYGGSFGQPRSPETDGDLRYPHHQQRQPRRVPNQTRFSHEFDFIRAQEQEFRDQSLVKPDDSKRASRDDFAMLISYS